MKRSVPCFPEPSMKKKRFATPWMILNELEGVGYYWKIGSFALAIGATVHFGFIFLFAWGHAWVLSFFNIFSVLMYGYAIFGLLPGSLHKEKEIDAKIGWIVFSELLSHNLLASYYLGRDSGFVYYIYVLVGLPFFVDAFDKKVYFSQKALALSVVFFIVFCSCFDQNKTDIPPHAIAIMQDINLFLFLAISCLLSYAYADNAQAYQRILMEESGKDVLTGLFNRRYMLRRQSASSLSPFAVALLDIDFFKRVNDTYGHQCGDEVIRKIADIIRNAIDDTSIACRWGGEEFLVLFDDTNVQKIEQTLENIRLRVENEAVPCGRKTVAVTVTAGVAYDLSQQSGFDKLLQHADEALYEGKEGGRNCVRTRVIDPAG